MNMQEPIMLYECPFCGSTYTEKHECVEHMRTCPHNPECFGCFSCARYWKRAQYEDEICCTKHQIVRSAKVACESWLKI